jgi:hypothetical protein
VEAIHGVAAPGPELHEACGGTLRRVMSAPTTRVKEPGSTTDTRHTSMLRFQENSRIAAEKQRKKTR